MASKIFMGDMPELMEKILNNLNVEFYSLYSCALVNRHWCKISIPILWKDPFSFGPNPLFISKYFSSLSEDEKSSLKECGINVEFPKTLFDYARFLKVLDLPCLVSMVTRWIFDFDSKLDYYKSVYCITELLLKLFVESGATLHKLDLYFLDYEINPEIFHALGRNEQSFSQLQNLSLGITSYLNTENTTILLKILAKNSKKISSLKFNEFCSDYNEPQLFHTLICFIKSQKQLRNFSLVGKGYLTEFYGIISALESQKNSLQEVTIENCAYSTEFGILKDCKKLEILHIRCCDYQKLLKISDYNISTLEIVDRQIDSSAIVQILEKCGILLQRLKLESDYRISDESLLIKKLGSCPNITYLNIWNIGFSTQLLELIDNLQKLQFLTLWYIADIPKEELKMRIKQFAKILPITLQYLDLRNSWIESHIDILLNHCNLPLKKLLIYHLDSKKSSKTLIKFCTRIKTLNYVGLDRYFYLNDNIKKEVEAYVTLVPYSRIVINC